MTSTAHRRHAGSSDAPLAPSRYRRTHRHHAAHADAESVRLTKRKVLHIIHAQAGLLVNAVRALATSATEEQRELEKQRLLSGHAETAASIDNLVTKHQGELQV